MVAVLGANGAGKSTLMRALAGLHRPVQGSIRFAGENARAACRRTRSSRAAWCWCPKGRQVFPELTVLDNIRLGALPAQGRVRTTDVEAMLERFPRLRERLHQRAGLLSGGEQQMLALARGLMARPRLLLLDEPSLGLAPAVINDLFAALDRLRGEQVTILLVDQMAGLALALADRAYVIEGGRDRRDRDRGGDRRGRRAGEGIPRRHRLGQSARRPVCTRRHLRRRLDVGRNFTMFFDFLTIPPARSTYHRARGSRLSKITNNSVASRPGRRRAAAREGLRSCSRGPVSPFVVVMPMSSVTEGSPRRSAIRHSGASRSSRRSSSACSCRPRSPAPSTPRARPTRTRSRSTRKSASGSTRRPTSTSRGR